MSITPVNLTRVPDLLRSSSTLGQIDQTQAALQTLTTELSTGKKVNQPSDDPAATVLIQEVQKTIDARTAYASNLQQSNSQLSQVDSTLGSLTDLLQQAQSTASANVGTDTTASQRQAAAAIIQNLYAQAVNLGNTQYNGAYIFGGTKSTTAPFQDVNGVLTFTGSTTILQNTVDDGTVRPFQVDGNAVFGAISTRVQGTVKLNPTIDATTRLSDLAGAGQNGVTPGSIQISDGTTSTIVDLSKAENVGDVVNAINASGLANVTASIGTHGINLDPTGAANISVSEISGGSTAQDLGILNQAGAGAGNELTGQSLNANVTALTPISALQDGAGLDLSGLSITNGATTTNVSFTGATTVQDILNDLNGSKAGVKAQINSSGTGINIQNVTQGSTLAIAENGGQTAAQLGVRSFSPSTPLSELNNGSGVSSVAGGDFQITRADGSNFSVSITGAKTVQDVIDDINAADAGGGVTASFATTGNGIVLTDNTGGSGTLAVTSLNASQAASELGIAQSAVGNVITGTDVNTVPASGVLGDLANLQNALQTNNTAGINAAAQGLQNDYNNVVTIRGANGANLQDIQSRQTDLQSENVTSQALLSNLQDTDYASAITQFQTLQTELQANYSVTARMQQLSLIDFLA